MSSTPDTVRACITHPFVALLREQDVDAVPRELTAVRA